MVYNRLLLMNREDFKNFTNDEILNLLVDVVNQMESNGNRYMEYYNGSNDKDSDIGKYTYAAGLLTQVNYVKIMILSKNETIEGYDKEEMDGLVEKLKNQTMNLTR